MLGQQIKREAGGKAGKLAAFALAGIMAAGMLCASMIGTSKANAATYDTTQDKSTSTATVELGKILNVNQNNKFPNITDFNFSVERVEAWDNSNTDTTKNGKAIEKSAIPMPSGSTTEHQKVTVSGDTAAITIGNFKDKADGDTAIQKTRTNPLKITFTKAGYYVYKVKETGSAPAKVSGVTYDTHEYFVVIYVTNKMDKDGNTIDGVYVHDITSYRNESGSEIYKPALSDIANVTDNNNQAAKENNETNLAKVGISSKDDPDALEAYRFFNSQDTHDIVVSKNVTGGLGDIHKEFEFTVTLKNLEPTVTYTTNETTSDNQKTTGAKIVSASVGTADVNAQTVTADENGSVTFLVKMTDDQKIVINAVPQTASYMISEAASDHVASYKITSDSKTAVIAKANDANSKDKTALATATETIDANDGTVTIAYTNDRNIVTQTGLSTTAFFTLLAGIIAGIVLMIIGIRAYRKRRDVSDSLNVVEM